MALVEPFPDLEEILASIGAGGSHVAAIEASEGAAGNISVFVGWPMEVRRRFPIAEEIALPAPAPHLANGIGHRHRLGPTPPRDQDDPAANLGVVRVSPDGTTRHCSTRRRTGSSSA
jgi:rhamnulose-1-phosphate aldolase